MKIFKVDEESVRMRLDAFMCGKFPDLSRAYIQRLIQTGEITVNDVQTKSGWRLKEKDKIVLHVDIEKAQKIEDIELPILYQDDNVVVINKPTGVISHSRGKFWYEPSVASFMRQISGQEGERTGIVHRLDRATSGVMVCARNQQTVKYLQKQFADRTVSKTYTAIIGGAIDPAEAVIDMPIERNPKKPQVFRVGAQGKAAITHYKTQQSTADHTLLSLFPKTGRTHQLRVHLAHLGHPIVGDELYEGETAKRLMLHASQIELKLPGGEPTSFSAPLPGDFKQLMKGAK